MRMFASACLIARVALTALAGCATPFDNQPLNRPVTPRSVQSSQQPRDIVCTPYGPLNAADAVRLRRMRFLIVHAGRPPTGDWALAIEGPSGLDVGIAAADAAIDSAMRLSAARFRSMTSEWRDSIVRDAARRNPALKAYLADRAARP